MFNIYPCQHKLIYLIENVVVRIYILHRMILVAFRTMQRDSRRRPEFDVVQSMSSDAYGEVDVQISGLVIGKFCMIYHLH